LGKPVLVSFHIFRRLESFPVGLYELVPDDDNPSKSRREGMKAAERFYFHQATAHAWYTKVNRRSGPQTGLWEVSPGSPTACLIKNGYRVSGIAKGQGRRVRFPELRAAAPPRAIDATLATCKVTSQVLTFCISKSRSFYALVATNGKCFIDS
jgi:hypothetical protein